MRVLDVLIPLSARPRSIAGAAALKLVLDRTTWRHWRPVVRLLVGPDIDRDLLARWAPYLPRSEDVPVTGSAGAFLVAATEAAMVLAISPDVIPVGSLEAALDAVHRAGGVGGVVARCGFSAWPGRPSGSMWEKLSAELLGRPVEASAPCWLRPEGDDGGAVPFRPDPAVVLFSGRIAPTLSEAFAGLLPLVEERLPVRAFAAEAALALAIAKVSAPTVPLALRYDFPNDNGAAVRFPEELADVRGLNCSNRDRIGDDVFANAGAYAGFVAAPLDSVDAIFRDRTVAILGEAYPFPAADAPRTPTRRARRTPPPGSPTGTPYFDYAKGRPNLHLLMRLKQSLVGDFGVQEAFSIYSDTLCLPDCERLELKPLDGEHAFARRSGLVLRETAPAGERFFLDPPEVIGPGNHRRLHGTTRALYVACLPDAQVRGRSAVIESRGMALLDVQDQEWGRFDDELDWDPSIFHAQGRDAWVVSPGEAAEPMRLSSAFSLLGAHTDFFGHWMIEYLPKYVAARLSGLQAETPVLVDADMPESHVGALALLFGRGLELIQIPAFRTVLVERLWCAPTLMPMPMHEKHNHRFTWDAVAAPPARFASVFEEFRRRLDGALGPVAGPKRVFLARKDFRHRRMVNGAAIEAVAEEQGFRTLYPEDFSFEDQVRFVRGAEFVIAPEGSAVFLLMFANPGLKLCILSHPVTDLLADYNGLLAPQGIGITVFTGPITKENRQTPQDSDYRIDTAEFAAFLERWLP